MKRLFALLPLLVVLAACGESQPSNISTITSPTPAPARHFKVGETVNVGSTWKVVIHSVNTNKGTDYLVPSNAGDVFMMIDVTLSNVSQKQQELYGGLWTLRGPDGQKYSTIMSADPPSGAIEAGTPARGTLGYEVPGSVKQFRLAFENAVWTPNQVIWDIAV